MNEKTAEKTSLEIIRFINVPPARVYDAWTDPAQLREWFGPENVRTRNITADVRVGGKYRWDLTSLEGEEMSAFGEYRELIPGKKIVFTWKWDDDENWTTHNSIATVELFDRDGGTELLFKHEQLPSEESRDRHNEGWNSILDRLETFFSKTKEENMTTEEVAKKVVELTRKQAWYEALDLYDDDVVSVEAYSMGGGSPETRGKEGVRGKIDWWVNAMEVHSFDAYQPFVGHDRFVVQYEADVSDKKTKERRKMSEVGVYTVKNGKIVREEFLPVVSA